jgi:type II secretory pathway pseudopilin PulG
MLKRHGEGGYTLLELAVTMSIMLVVIGGLLGALESGTSAERNASTRIDDEQAVAVVLAQFTRDVRNASAIETVPTASLSTTVELVEPSGSGSQYVRWAIEPAGSNFALTRYLATSPGDPGSPGVTVGGLTGASVFDRQSVNGTELVNPPPAFLLTETDAARCAGTIEASIVSNAHPPSAPFTENVAAQVHATTSVVAASFEPVGQLDVRGCP